MNSDTEIQIKRSKRRFAMIPTAILENSLLSWKAKGLISYLLSRPDGWKVRVSDLTNRSTDGRDAVKSALKELRLIGHAEIIYNRNEKGHIKGSCYLIHEEQIKVDATTERRKTRRTEKPSDGKPVDLLKKDYNNKDYNNKDYNNKEKEKDVTTNASLFVAPADLVLKKYLNSDSFLLRLPDQPSAKVLQRWREIYEEAYLKRQFLKAEKYFKNKKNSAKKIKSISRTLNEFLKKEWISDRTERKVLKVFQDWHKENFDFPSNFDRYQSSEDRRRLEEFVSYCKQFLKDPVREIELTLPRLPEFWKGKRFASILKNFKAIDHEIARKVKEEYIRDIRGGDKQSATVENMNWYRAEQN